MFKKRRFLPLFITQFLGVLNDNVFKNAIVILITYSLSNEMVIHSQLLVIFAASIFILPFFLFSAAAGQIADKFEKSMLVRRIKAAEIGIMLLAGISFYYMNPWLLIAVLFLMGTQSALFGPLKYSILPQHLRPEELLSGNGIIQTATYIGILIGTIGGGLLIAVRPNGNIYTAVIVMIIAISGWFASRYIPNAPAADCELKIEWNLFLGIKKIVHYAREKKSVFWAIIAVAWFWFYGTVFLSLLPSYTRNVLYADEKIASLILALFAIGIGIGALLCSFLSTQHGRLATMPLGAMGLSVFAVIISLIKLPELSLAADELLDIGLFLQYPSHYWVLISIVLIGLAGGLYIVPLYTFIQQRSTPIYRSRIVAANNVIDALAMVIAAIVLLFLVWIGIAVTQIFFIVALLNAVMMGLLFIKVATLFKRNNSHAE